jgi:hypothetical protein
LLLYSSKPSLGVYQLAGHLLQANKFPGTIITVPSPGQVQTWLRSGSSFSVFMLPLSFSLGVAFSRANRWLNI